MSNVNNHMPLMRKTIAFAEEHIFIETGVRVLITISGIWPDDAATKIALECCKIWDTNMNVLCGNARTKETVAKRSILCWLLKETTKLSLGDIAKRMGYKQHSHTHHSIRDARTHYSTNDPFFMQFYNPIKFLFNEPVDAKI